VLAPEPDPRIETPAPAESVRVFVRLRTGDAIEVATFADRETAESRAAEIVDAIVNAERWPMVGRRFVRPEAIVSVDVEPVAA
jgi:hypothetical protein